MHLEHDNITSNVFFLFTGPPPFPRIVAPLSERKTKRMQLLSFLVQIGLNMFLDPYYI